jgi:hypothetical protein
MALQRGADLGDRRARDVVDQDHRMRVAHRGDRELDATAGELDRVARAVGDLRDAGRAGQERQRRGLEARRAHVHRDAAGLLEARVHQAAGLSIASVPPSARPARRSHSATQRAPLPHCSTSPPSALKMR